ncbi:MAG: hypothetical protein MJE68_26025 [Proteobacteria bacterium]|nr:hypothetical protein [Pseudomonadota bacterium]
MSIDVDMHQRTLIGGYRYWSVLRQVVSKKHHYHVKSLATGQAQHKREREFEGERSRGREKEVEGENQRIP